MSNRRNLTKIDTSDRLMYVKLRNTKKVCVLSNCISYQRVRRKFQHKNLYNNNNIYVCAIFSKASRVQFYCIPQCLKCSHIYVETLLASEMHNRATQNWPFEKQQTLISTSTTFNKILYFLILQNKKEILFFYFVTNQFGIVKDYNMGSKDHLQEFLQRISFRGKKYWKLVSSQL